MTIDFRWLMFCLLFTSVTAFMYRDNTSENWMQKRNWDDYDQLLIPDAVSLHARGEGYRPAKLQVSTASTSKGVKGATQAVSVPASAARTPSQQRPEKVKKLQPVQTTNLALGRSSPNIDRTSTPSQRDAAQKRPSTTQLRTQSSPGDLGRTGGRFERHKSGTDGRPKVSTPSAASLKSPDKSEKTMLRTSSSPQLGRAKEASSFRALSPSAVRKIQSMKNADKTRPGSSSNTTKGSQLQASGMSRADGTSAPKSTKPQVQNKQKPKDDAGPNRPLSINKKSSGARAKSTHNDRVRTKSSPSNGGKGSKSRIKISSKARKSGDSSLRSTSFSSKQSSSSPKRAPLKIPAQTPAVIESAGRQMILEPGTEATIPPNAGETIIRLPDAGPPGLPRKNSVDRLRELASQSGNVGAVGTAAITNFAKDNKYLASAFCVAVVGNCLNVAASVMASRPNQATKDLGAGFSIAGNSIGAVGTIGTLGGLVYAVARTTPYEELRNQGVEQAKGWRQACADGYNWVSGKCVAVVKKTGETLGLVRDDRLPIKRDLDSSTRISRISLDQAILLERRTAIQTRHLLNRASMYGPLPILWHR